MTPSTSRIARTLRSTAMVVHLWARQHHGVESLLICCLALVCAGWEWRADHSVVAIALLVGSVYALGSTIARLVRSGHQLAGAYRDLDRRGLVVVGLVPVSQVASPYADTELSTEEWN